MKTIDHILIGLVVNNQDPDNRGRVQVFIPQLTNLYNGWNQNKQDIKFRTLDSDVFSPEIIQRLSDVLPWADVASPFFGGGTAAPVNTYTTEPETTPTGPVEVDASDDERWNVDEMDFINDSDSDLKASSPDTIIEDGIRIKQGVNISGLQPEIKQFAKELSYINPYAVISSGTDGRHASGAYSHGTGYKVDIRMNGGGGALTSEQKRQVEIDTANLAAKYGFNVLVENDNGSNGHLDVGYNPTQKREDAYYKVRNGFNSFESTNDAINAFRVTKKFNKKQPPKDALANKSGEPTTEEILSADDAPLPSEDPSNESTEIASERTPLPELFDRQEQILVKRETIPPPDNTGPANAGSSIGAFSTPQVGAKAYVMFLDGNPMRPIVIGCFVEPKNYAAA